MTMNKNNAQNLDKIRNGEKVILSNSMVKAFKTCERQFVYNYVLSKEKDSDYISPKYFAFGNAFHKVLEDTLHDSNKFTVELLNSVSDEFGLDPVYEKAKLVQCLKLYYQEHNKSGLKILDVEVYFKSQNAGTIDAIAIDSNGWWIIDLKTAASLSNMRPELLNVDTQVGLYASHAPEVQALLEEKHGIQLGEFLGIKLREVTKAKERKKKEVENFDQFYNRLKPIEFRELTLEKQYIECEETRHYMEVESERVNDTIKKFIEGGENIKNVIRNTNSCSNPLTKEFCPFFSTCHGKSASEILYGKIEDLTDLLDF